MIESIKKAFILSVKAVKLFYVLAAVNVIGSIVNLLVVGALMNAVRFLASTGVVILLSLVGIFVQGGAFAYVKELIKTGSASLASFVDNAKKYFLRLLCIYLIFLLPLAILGFFAGIFMPTISNFATTGLNITIIVFLVIFFIVFFTVFSVLFIMPGYALVGSDLGVIESIKKGILVGRKNFFKILGILVILLVAYIAVGIVTSIMGVISDFIPDIVAAIMNAALAVLMHIAFMDFYLKSITEENLQS